MVSFKGDILKKTKIRKSSWGACQDLIGWSGQLGRIDRRPLAGKQWVKKQGEKDFGEADRDIITLSLSAMVMYLVLL